MCDNISGNVGSFAESIPYSRENEEKLQERVQGESAKTWKPRGNTEDGKVDRGAGRRHRAPELHQGPGPAHRQSGHQSPMACVEPHYMLLTKLDTLRPPFSARLLSCPGIHSSMCSKGYMKNIHMKSCLDDAYKILRLLRPSTEAPTHCLASGAPPAMRGRQQLPPCVFISEQGPIH